MRLLEIPLAGFPSSSLNRVLNFAKKYVPAELMGTSAATFPIVTQGLGLGLAAFSFSLCSNLAYIDP